MELSESILTSIKKLLGITEEYTQFDQDIIMHINSAFTILTQLGVGPSTGFAISDKSAVWTDFVEDITQFSIIKSYVHLRVWLLFDETNLSSAVITSIKEQISEFEWRIQVPAEPSDS